MTNEKKTTKILLIVLVVLAVIIAVSSVWLCAFRLYDFNTHKSAYFEREFSSEIWKADYHSHNAMIDDLLETYDLQGFTRSEVAELLGEPTGDDNWGDAYLYFIKGGSSAPIYLYIYFDESGRVTRYILKS
jgi:outer membrane protein assembly factor BamE (lipoprotein component of BamABCDE complex)